MSKTDPTFIEMRAYLDSLPGGDVDDEAERVFCQAEAIYWFASHEHSGQWSNLYSALSTSEYRPGALTTYDSFRRYGGLSVDYYDALVAQFGA